MLLVMKTYRYAGSPSLDHLEPVLVPEPIPGPGEVVLGIVAVSLNHRDLAIARGAYPGMPHGLVPCSDAAGYVLARGPGALKLEVGALALPSYVPDWKQGAPTEASARRRLGGPSNGVLAERLVVHEDALVRAPRLLDPFEASTLPVAGASAFQVLADAGVRRGDVVGVRGTGAASLWLVSIALALGAKVIVVGRSAAKLGRFAAMGTDTALAGPGWESRVRERFPDGVDVLVDAVGGDDLQRSIAATRYGGRVVLYGFVGGTSATIDLVGTIRKSVTLMAVSGASQASLEALVDFVDAHRLRPVIDRVFAFSDAKRAFGYLDEASPFGKVVIAIDEVMR